MENNKKAIALLTLELVQLKPKLAHCAKQFEYHLREAKSWKPLVQAGRDKLKDITSAIIKLKGDDQ